MDLVGIAGWLLVYRVFDRYSRLVAGISCVVVGITVWQVCSVDDRYTEMLVATYPIDRIA